MISNFNRRLLKVKCNKCLIKANCRGNLDILYINAYKTFIVLTTYLKPDAYQLWKGIFLYDAEKSSKTIPVKKRTW